MLLSSIIYECNLCLHQRSTAVEECQSQSLPHYYDSALSRNISSHIDVLHVDF